MDLNKIIVLFCLVFSCNTSFCQMGALDGSFDFDGKVLTSFGTLDSRIFDIAVQSDGKIIAAGSYGSIGSADVSIARYNQDGGIDSSFAVNGYFINNFSPGQDFIHCVAIQPDGKILAAGELNSPNRDILVLRFNTDGTLDSTFANNGVMVTYITFANETAEEIKVSNSGKIIVGCSMSYGSWSEFGLICLNSNGSFDTTFNGTGKANYNLSGSNFLKSIYVLPDNKILAAGSTGNAGIIAKFTESGILDTTFNSTGFILGINGSGFSSILVQNDGKIVTGGGISLGSYSRFLVSRFNDNGTTDSKFNGTGYLTISSGASQNDYLYEILLQPDGKIIAGGNTRNQITFGTGNYFISRVGTNGIIDNSFGASGKVITDFAADEDICFSMSIQPDLKIVAGGETYQNSKWHFSLARYFSGLNVGTIKLPDSNSSFFVQPNPVGDILNISYQLNSDMDLSIELYDILGKKVKNLNNHVPFIKGINSDSFFVADLPQGIYTLKVTSKGWECSKQFLKN